MNLRKLSGYHLKYIALFSMLLDLIGVIFQASLPTTLFFLLRAVGRLSFPLFCFILVEGFFHTKNRKTYQWRLLIFAVLSEIPYVLAFSYLPADITGFSLSSQHPFRSFASAFQQQNILFTLFLGFTAMKWMERTPQRRQNSIYKNIDILILFCCISEIFRTDCGSAGILCIFFFYSFYKEREQKKGTSGTSGGFTIKEGLIGIAPAALLTYITPFPVQLFAFADSLILHCYNGERGKGYKYFFYLFYPLHLMVLFFCFV